MPQAWQTQQLAVYVNAFLAAQTLQHFKSNLLKVMNLSKIFQITSNLESSSPEFKRKKQFGVNGLP